jgi:chemotaxis protein CheX
MPIAANLPDQLLEETVNRAVSDVFSTMLGCEAVPASTEDLGDVLRLEAAHVVGTVGFIGEMKGLIYLYFKEDFAEQCACDMLGMTRAEMIEGGEEVVNDAIGEITNMTVGTFKNQLADRGSPCRLTIPSIMRGSHFQVEPIQEASRRVFRFTVHDHVLTVDLMMQPGE